MDDFARRFGAVILASGWHISDDISIFSWEDQSWLSFAPYDDYDARRAQHIAEINNMIDWDKVTEADFDIGWWSKFCGTFTDNSTVQLIRANFPLADGSRLAWAAEISMADAIQKTCTGLKIRSRYDTF